MDTGGSFSPCDPAAQRCVNHRQDGVEETPRIHDSLWSRYRTWARQQQHLLYLLDDTASRVLFWTPPSNSNNGSNTSRWRDMAWGVLELHRLLLDHSVLQDDDRPSPIASVEATDDDAQWLHLTNQRLQWALTIIQTLYPVLHQMVGGTNRPGADQRQAKVRKYVETIRFLLRGMQLVRYWKSLGSTSVPPGLILEGGRMTITPQTNQGPSWTAEEEERRIAQHNYVGRRTGKRWSTTATANGNSPPIRTDWVARRRTQLAEVLYIVRPLVQAHAEGLPQRRQRSLGIPLLLDLASLWLSAQQHNSTNSNPASKAEWQRRRMRLWLYLLRSPIWDRYTEPTATAMRDRVEHNFVGRMASSYVWEWLYYWKDYRMEEG